MYKHLKRQALTLFSLYKMEFIVLSFFLMISNTIIILATSYFAESYGISSLQTNESLLIIILLILFGFIINPLFQVVLIKACILAQKNERKIIIKSLKFIFDFRSIKQIVLINFLQQLTLIVLMIITNKFFVLSNTLIVRLFDVFLFVILIFTNYKLFISNYFYAFSSECLKKIFLMSFKVMKKKLKNYVLFWISFLAWVLAVIILGLIVQAIATKNIFSFCYYYIYPLYFKVLKGFGYGIFIFLVPYYYLTKTLYIKTLIGNTKWDK